MSIKAEVDNANGVNIDVNVNMKNAVCVELVDDVSE